MVLAALRTQTRPAHERLEAQLDLLHPEFTRAQYQSLLERQFQLYLPLEPAIAQRLPAAWRSRLGWPARLKTRLLRADLAALGEGGWTPDGVPATDLPPLPDEAAAWGALYVLEGATLGGQIICRHLGPQLKLSPTCGLSFYASYGALIGPRWKEFCALLTQRWEQADEPAAFLASAVRGARETFGCFERRVAPALAAPQRGVA